MSGLRAFCMPKWGIEMTEGTVAEWLVAEGARLSKGDMLCLIETAKITNEVEAERDGVLLRIVEPAGEELPVGTLLAVLGDGAAEAADVDAFVADFVPSDGGTGRARKAVDQAEAVEARAAPAAVETNRPISPQALALAQAEGVDLARIEGSGRGGRITYQDAHQFTRPAATVALRGPAPLPPEDRTIFASPLARRLAALHGVELAGMSGSGARGRISKADVLGRVANAPSPVADGSFALADDRPEVEPFDKLRKVAARRLGEAKRDIPHFYLRVSARADALIALRKTANLVLGCNATLNDLLVMAAGKALVRHPAMNVQVHGESLHRFAHADIGIAVDSPKGLVAPVVRQVDRMTLAQLAAATAAIIEKARAGRLSYDDLEGGTFSVSNLGMFGVESFDAIINPPQAAILAVGAAHRLPVERGDGAAGFETRIALTLSLDHRAVDGAQGARFLATLKSLIEEPEQLFV